MQNSRTPAFSETKRKKNPTPKEDLRIGKKATRTTREPDHVYPISMSNSDSSSGNEYRALRRKYLLLEEHSFALETELKEAEDQVRALEDEKVQLLDKLVVMEGLVHP